MSKGLELGNQGAGVGTLGAGIMGISSDISLGVLVKVGFRDCAQERSEGERMVSLGTLGKLLGF